LTDARRRGDNEPMIIPDESPKPFQFGLRSIFVATAAVGMALALLKWLGPADFTGLVFLAVPCSAAIVVLVKSKGTSWPGFVLPGLLSLILLAPGVPRPVILFLAGCLAWGGGGMTASEATRDQSRFLEWSWLMALVWFLFAVVSILFIWRPFGPVAAVGLLDTCWLAVTTS
jgi:hypothetical protein